MGVQNVCETGSREVDQNTAAVIQQGSDEGLTPGSGEKDEFESYEELESADLRKVQMVVVGKIEESGWPPGFLLR